MRVILVGTDTQRARLREQASDTDLVIVGEAVSRADARAHPAEADALLLAAATELSERSSHAEELTPREAEVLDLLTQGLANKTIAQRLGISDQTVKFHVAAISAKLGASNRTDAVRLAIQRGLVTL